MISFNLKLTWGKNYWLNRRRGQEGGWAPKKVFSRSLWELAFSFLTKARVCGALHLLAASFPIPKVVPSVNHLR
jgi:hypothetical protein